MSWNLHQHLGLNRLQIPQNVPITNLISDPITKHIPKPYIPPLTLTASCHFTYNILLLALYLPASTTAK